MKSKNIIPLIILLSTLNFISCKKFLDKQSDNSYTVPQSLSDLQALLDDADVMNNMVTPSYGSASADNYFLPLDVYNSMSDELKQTYTWIPHDYLSPNDWAYSYLPIYNSNYCLETLDTIPVTSDNSTMWRNVKGSSLFFRAYYFLELSWVYSKAYDKNTASSDPGIVLRLTSDFNVKSVRSTVQESYDRIIMDAKESIQYLPDLPAHPMRPSKAAAYGLLARAYLSMRQYDSAFKYANSCLELKDTLLDYNDGSINIGANVPFQPFNEEIIFFTSMNPTNGTFGTYFARVDTSLYASYDSSDLRKLIFFRPNDTYQRFKGSYASSVSASFSGIAVDEMYLIRAECYARANNIEAALADLNTLMIKRWKNTVPYKSITATTSDEALQLILIERRKELLFRGLRWMDIKRLNKEGYNIILTRKIGDSSFTLPPNDNKYALPLPSDIISQTGIEQNPQ